MTSTTAASTAKPGYHHGDLEAALVAEALALVRSRGADAVSLRQVAQAVGVSPSAAYAHFPDKDALMTEVAQRGHDILDARMLATAQSIVGDDDRAAIERFWSTGEAYVGFALAEPHLFRHAFGPCCPTAHQIAQADQARTSLSPTDLAEDSGSYRLLCEGLDDLQQRGLLRAGIREGLDVLVWTTVHGFASLVLDGLLPIEWRALLLRSLTRLTLAVEWAPAEAT
ncbi:MAG: TetR/AcrR family transcriptional regulator [Nocardioides sp.]